MESVPSDRLLTLRGTLKRIGNFDSSTFEGRLIFQKTVYFLQVFKFDFGYKFNWYVYGPYSKELADDGFSITDTNSSKEIKFVNDDFEKRFSVLLAFLGSRKNDPKWLELLASIDFLTRSYPNKNKVDILNIIKTKQTYFTETEFNEAYKYLQNLGILQM